MVIPVDVDVNEIARFGRDFFWQKPSCCPCCGAGLWWHGFVLAFFDHLNQGVFLRRLRCPCCGAVHRLRPKAYWSRFRSSIQTIRQTIISRIKTLKWRKDLPRSRQRLWWRRFCRHAKIMIGLNWEIFPDPFDILVKWKTIPVSNSF